jgi:hypothetical protein
MRGFLLGRQSGTQRASESKGLKDRFELIDVMSDG